MYAPTDAGLMARPGEGGELQNGASSSHRPGDRSSARSRPNAVPPPARVQPHDHPPTLEFITLITEPSPHPPSPTTAAAEQMQDAARLVTNLQTESDGVDLVTLLRETPREAYSFQQLGVSGLIGAPDDTRTLIIDRPLNHSFIHFQSNRDRSHRAPHSTHTLNRPF